MVTEGPESLMEFSRDAKEVRPSLLWFGIVLKRHSHKAQGRLCYWEGREEWGRAYMGS